jgi:hypothetical protein
VLGRVGAEVAEHLAPRRDRRPLCDRLGTRTVGGQVLLGVVLIRKHPRRHAVGDVARLDDAVANGREARYDIGRVVEPDHMTAFASM